MLTLDVMEQVNMDANKEKGFRKLVVWKRTHELVLSVY